MSALGAKSLKQDFVLGLVGTLVAVLLQVKTLVISTPPPHPEPLLTLIMESSTGSRLDLSTFMI